MTGKMINSSTKKHDPNPSKKINHNLKNILWSLTLQKKRIKKNVTFAGNWVIQNEIAQKKK